MNHLFKVGDLVTVIAGGLGDSRQVHYFQKGQTVRILDIIFDNHVICLGYTERHQKPVTQSMDLEHIEFIDVEIVE